jgi:hypothetical protein
VSSDAFFGVKPYFGELLLKGMSPLDRVLSMLGGHGYSKCNVTSRTHVKKRTLLLSMQLLNN